MNTIDAVKIRDIRGMLTLEIFTAERPQGELFTLTDSAAKALRDGMVTFRTRHEAEEEARAYGYFEKDERNWLGGESA